jgi:hypothetical protein
MVGLLLGPTAATLYVLGSIVHILQDQLGHMGTNLLYPITPRRTPGLGWFHSGDTLPNRFVVWLSAVLVLFNLDRFAAASTLSPWSIFAFGLALPWTLILCLSWWSHRRQGDHETSGNR